MKHDLVAHCGAVGDFASFALWRVLFLLGFVVQYTPTRSSRVQKIASAGEVSFANSFFSSGQQDCSPMDISLDCWLARSLYLVALSPQDVFSVSRIAHRYFVLSCGLHQG